MSKDTPKVKSDQQFFWALIVAGIVYAILVLYVDYRLMHAFSNWWPGIIIVTVIVTAVAYSFAEGWWQRRNAPDPWAPMRGEVGYCGDGPNDEPPRSA